MKAGCFCRNCSAARKWTCWRARPRVSTTPSGPEVWREKSGAPRTAFAAHLYNEAFGLLGAHPRMIDPVEQVFGEKVYMHQYKINAKSAFTGDVWQWHQDYGTWKRDDGMPRSRVR